MIADLGVGVRHWLELLVAVAAVRAEALTYQSCPVTRRRKADAGPSAPLKGASLRMTECCGGMSAGLFDIVDERPVAQATPNREAIFVRLKPHAPSEMRKGRPFIQPNRNADLAVRVLVYIESLLVVVARLKSCPDTSCLFR